MRQRGLLETGGLQRGAQGLGEAQLGESGERVRFAAAAGGFILGRRVVARRRRARRVVRGDDDGARGVLRGVRARLGCITGRTRRDERAEPASSRIEADGQGPEARPGRARRDRAAASWRGTNLARATAQGVRANSRARRRARARRAWRASSGTTRPPSLLLARGSWFFVRCGAPGKCAPPYPQNREGSCQFAEWCSLLEKAPALPCVLFDVLPRGTVRRARARTSPETRSRASRRRVG